MAFDSVVIAGEMRIALRKAILFGSIHAVRQDLSIQKLLKHVSRAVCFPTSDDILTYDGSRMGT